MKRLKLNSAPKYRYHEEWWAIFQQVMITDQPNHRWMIRDTIKAGNTQEFENGR